MLQPILPIGIDNHQEGGFTLLEVICAVAIMALLAAIALPSFHPGTSRARLESYAIAAAALLKGDHDAALRKRMDIATQVNAVAGVIRSGATGRTVHVPADVTFDALFSARCGHLKEQATILFFSSGMSCGGFLTMARSGVRYEIRVNWLTGGVEIARSNQT